MKLFAIMFIVVYLIISHLKRFPFNKDASMQRLKKQQAAFIQYANTQKAIWGKKNQEYNMEREWVIYDFFYR